MPLRPGLEPWLDTRQIAEHLGMGVRWVQLRTAEGMPSQKFGRARRFRVSEVERWLTDRCAR
jgi:excisionase family DNA binding protein